MSALVSVIIPTFDRGHVLRETVDSVLAQTHRDLEVIVIDDGSSDGTRELVASTFGDDPRVHYHYQANAGVASARNAGLDLATGEYIAFLDSDDAWKPWHLSLLLAGLDRHAEAGMIWTDMEAVDAGGSVVSSSYLTELLSAYRYFSRDDLFSSSSALSDLGIDIPTGDLDRRLYVGDIFSPMIMGNLVLTSSAVIRRERLERVGQFDEALAAGEDYEFFLRVCRAGPVAFADIADTRYRVGAADRLSGSTMGLTMAEGYLQVLETTLARDAERITLSLALIDEARSYARAWVGEQQLYAGSRRIARAYLAAALRIRFRRPRVWLLFVLTYLPRAVVGAMIRAGLRLRGSSAA
jgi:glycosyltransferase involved in cell wall biosynthesis